MNTAVSRQADKQHTVTFCTMQLQRSLRTLRTTESGRLNSLEASATGKAIWPPFFLTRASRLRSSLPAHASSRVSKASLHAGELAHDAQAHKLPTADRASLSQVNQVLDWPSSQDDHTSDQHHQYPARFSLHQFSLNSMNRTLATRTQRLACYHARPAGWALLTATCWAEGCA